MRQTSHGKVQNMILPLELPSYTSTTLSWAFVHISTMQGLQYKPRDFLPRFSNSVKLWWCWLCQAELCALLGFNNHYRITSTFSCMSNQRCTLNKKCEHTWTTICNCKQTRYLIKSKYTATDHCAFITVLTGSDTIQCCMRTTQNGWSSCMYSEIHDGILIAFWNEVSAINCQI